MAPRPPPGLMDDLIGEILLRLPPEDPECLFRASVVCKPWRRLLSDPGFLRRYREFHGAPPLFGFLHTSCGWPRDRWRFVAFKKVSPILNQQPEADSSILDCRHGRVLLLEYKTGLVIWDPITNIRQNIAQPEIKGKLLCFAAAVLCAVVGCDHLGCCGGPSLVVSVQIFIAIRDDQRRATASASVYSTEASTWNGVASSVQVRHLMIGNDCKMMGSSLLAGDAVYFVLEEGRRILKYDMAGRGLSLMSSPPLCVRSMVLMKAEGGGLGACRVEGHRMHLCAWRTGPGGISRWERDRVIQLDIGDLSTMLKVVDFAEGAGSIFLRTNKGVFAVELKSGRTRMVLKGEDLLDIFPFMIFYTPGTSVVPISP